MPPRRVLPLLLLLAATGFLAVTAVHASSPPARPTSRDAVASLPASNPYREAFLRLESLPREDRRLLGEWLSPPPASPAPELPAPLRALAAELAASVRAAASHPLTTAADWPFTPNPAAPDNPAEALTFLRLGAARELARIATRHADELPASESIDYYAAAAQLARQQRAAGTLIEQISGVAAEGIAHTAVSRRLGEFSPDELRRLSVAWESLHPRPSNAEAVAGERELYLLPLAQNVLLPGLRELLADPAAGLRSDSASPDSGFTRELRLSGLMDLGGGEHRILLENTRSGEHLSLRPGRSTEGIELVSLDFERRLAIIRRGTQEAEIHLQSKRIVERQSPAATLREQLAGLAVISGDGTRDDLLHQMIERARRHPEGPEGYVRDYLAAYDEGVARQLALADQAQAPEPDEPPHEDPLLARTLPTIGKVARTLNNSATASTMLQAAIQHRLGHFNQAVDPFAHPDPWASASTRSFTVEPGSDGGFLLRSVYEIAPGVPLTYKFAAPDSGFLRVQPQP